MGLDPAEASSWVEAGLITCHFCKAWFPVNHGLPVLLPYTTPFHVEFEGAYSAQMRRLPFQYSFARREPVPGEQFVMRSFSTEWLAYDFDGVIWEMDYATHERRFRAELGDFAPTTPGSRFLEVGCGIGITTDMAQRNYACDAFGVDLSLAALKACGNYRSNPFLHFVQASAFYLPLQKSAFQTVYSRGVLHHTYSTRAAFLSAAEACTDGGSIYLWVYGPGSTSETAFRKVAFAFEKPIRAMISRDASGLLAKLILMPAAAAYVVFNRTRRLKDRTIQPYNFSRALHAARDRFTPEFAHRHSAQEVVAWFEEVGCEDIEVVDWRQMPTADHDDYRRNTGVRGRRLVRKAI